VPDGVAISLVWCNDGVATFSVSVPPMPGNLVLDVVVSRPGTPDRSVRWAFYSGDFSSAAVEVGSGTSMVTWLYGGSTVIYHDTIVCT
jgi:hypothetical protein